MPRNIYIKPVFLLVLFFSAALIISCSGPKGDPVDGKRWFTMHTCYGCHGPSGDDGKGPDITGLDMNYSRFLKRLRNAESAIMPVYSEVKISDQDAADILAFINTL